MIPALPRYTASRLYTVTIEPLSREYIPGDHDPRYVVGMRAYINTEIPASPDNPALPASTANDAAFVTFIDHASREVVIRDVPFARCSQAVIITQSKVLAPASGFGTGPIVFPFQPPSYIDVAGSWIYNAERDPVTYLLELFFDDLWQPSR